MKNEEIRDKTIRESCYTIEEISGAFAPFLYLSIWFICDNDGRD
jgi:hypothetical protein